MQKENIKKYKKEVLADVRKGDLKKDEYDFSVQLVKDNCWKNYNPKKFKILKDSIEVIIDCEFPHVLLAINPPTTISLSMVALKQYFRRQYKDL